MKSAPATGLLRGDLATLFIVALATLLFAIRVTAPPDLRDNDQERPASYAMDFLQNGHWVVQFDQTGDVMSKPPLSTWLTALPALPFGKLDLFLLYLPSFLSVAGLGVVILHVGRHRFGPTTGLIAATLYLCSMVANKQVALSRTDPVFALLVFLAALAAFRASKEGKSWLPFWLLAAAVTLTKGPLGIVIALGGLAATLFERPRRNPLRGKHLPGLGLFLLLTGGWFALALWFEGRVVSDKMIFRELVGHAVKEDPGGFSVAQFFKPALYFLSRYAPWSLLTLAAIIQLFRGRLTDFFPPDPARTNFLRFLAAYLLFGIGLFSLSSHQRPDHLLPLIPAAALLAGFVASRALERVPARHLQTGLAILAAGFLGAVAYWAWFARGQAEVVRQTVAIRDLAGELQSTYGPEFSPRYVSVFYTLQFYLGTMRSEDSPADAARALASQEIVMVLTQNPDVVRSQLPAQAREKKLYAEMWMLPGGTELTLISNAPLR